MEHLIRAFIEAVVAREMLRGYHNDPCPTGLRIMTDGSVWLDYEVV